MIDLGQVYEATLTIAGQSAPPATATLTFTLPDGTSATPSVGPGAASGADWLLTYDYSTVQAGLHKAAWLTTGPTTAAVDYFSVRQFISVISLAEAKAHLQKTLGASAADAELRRFMMAATELVESKAGTCVRRAVTGELIRERLPGCRQPVIRLPSGPLPDATSVTSITSTRPGGPTWATADLTVDPATGTCWPSDGLGFWWGPWLATYTAGRAVVSETIIHAAKEQLRHLWETQRGAQAPQLLAGEQEFTTATGWQFTVPRRVLEALAPDMLPVVAA